MYRLSFVLTLCMYGALAFRWDYNLQEQDFWRNDQPSTVTGGNSKCKKDILLVVDTSWSIGNDFNKNVKPFLQNFVKNSLLNVGPDGTRIGLIIFGQEDKTRKILDVGQITDAEQLAKTIDNKLNYKKVGGSFTRTDLGLKIANQVFSHNNPMNDRSNVDDVVILMTDGEPRGIRNAVQLTKKYAQDLKDKDILLIVAAVGPKRMDFKPLMEELATSPENVLEADFNNMKTIMDQLIASSCIKPGQCTCFQSEANYKLEPGESTAMADWPKPEFACATGRPAAVESTVISPNIRPPHPFSAGKHVVTYQYNLRGDVTVECPVIINVKGFKGTCSCDENTTPIKRTVNSKESTVEVDSPSPQPTCVHGATVINKKTEPQLPHKFPAGLHEIKYTFFLKKAKVRTITCPVKVEVKVMCDGEPIFPSETSCCCGTTYEKITGYECCGTHYYDPKSKKCCWGVNLVSHSESC